MGKQCKERGVGEVFTDYHLMTTLKVINEYKTNCCNKCIFDHSGLCMKKKCSPDERSDGNFVYFKSIYQL